MKRLFALLIALVVAVCPVFSQKREPGKVKTVVIDPGHGGDKPGALGKKSAEKDLVLSIALKFGKLISDNYPDVEIIYTRSTDIDITLAERARIANRNKADLFVSVHANSCPSSSPTGVETFVMGLSQSKSNMDVAKKENADILLEAGYKNNSDYQGFDPNSPESYVMFAMYQNAYLDKSLNFAKYVQDQYKVNLHTIDRGVKQAEFIVLYKTTMPAVLTEVGFISNPEEEAYMMSDEGQARIAISLFNAFATYKAMEEGTKKPDNPKIDLPGYGDNKTVAKKNDNKPSNTKKTGTQDTKPSTKPSTESSVPAKTEKNANPKSDSTLALNTSAKPAEESPKTEAKTERVKMSHWIENTSEAAAQPQTTTPPEPAASQPKAEEKNNTGMPADIVEANASQSVAVAQQPQNQSAASQSATQPKTGQENAAAPVNTAAVTQQPEAKPAVPAQPKPQPPDSATILDKALYAAIAASRGEEVPVVERPQAPETENTQSNTGTATPKYVHNITPPPAPANKPGTASTVENRNMGSAPTAGKQDRVIYKVQFIRSDRQLKNGDSELHGVTGFEIYRQGNAYCYTMGAYNTSAEAKPKQNELRKLGFTDAFIVAFYRGQRISIQQAREMGY